MAVQRYHCSRRRRQSVNASRFEESGSGVQKPGASAALLAASSVLPGSWRRLHRCRRRCPTVGAASFRRMLCPRRSSLGCWCSTAHEVVVDCEGLMGHPGHGQAGRSRVAPQPWSRGDDAAVVGGSTAGVHAEDGAQGTAAVMARRSRRWSEQVVAGLAHTPRRRSVPPYQRSAALETPLGVRRGRAQVERAGPGRRRRRPRQWPPHRVRGARLGLLRAGGRSGDVTGSRRSAHGDYQAGARRASSPGRSSISQTVALVRLRGTSRLRVTAQRQPR